MRSRFLLFIVFFSLSLFISSLIASDLGFCNEEMALVGGVGDVPANQNSGEVESLARFAVDEHNKKEVPNLSSSSIFSHLSSRYVCFMLL